MERCIAEEFHIIYHPLSCLVIYLYQDQDGYSKNGFQREFIFDPEFIPNPSLSKEIIKDYNFLDDRNCLFDVELFEGIDQSPGI